VYEIILIGWAAVVFLSRKRICSKSLGIVVEKDGQGKDQHLPGANI